jgi:hypothetical protein
MFAAVTAKSTVSCNGALDCSKRYKLMVSALLLIIAGSAAESPGLQAGAPAVSHNPHAAELFERDWVLNQWAKRRFDANGDGRISLEETQPAAIAFKGIADGNSDGRVTPYEYERAREFILARY